MNESLLTAGVRIEPGKRYGFFTDTTLCIGCKACEVACKEWNDLPADHLELSANTWRHVKFVEKLGRDGERPTSMPPYQSHWLMMSDVCKHCAHAPCLEACPTGSLFKTEFDTVVVQHDICNGCGYCVPSCPFGVVEVSPIDGKAHKCTLCYDRLKGGFEPACAKACPTDSIQFGELEDLRQRAGDRVQHLRELGRDDAYVYGLPDGPGGELGGLNAFFLLTDAPEVYNLPAAPSRGADRVAPALLSGLGTFAALALATVGAFFLHGSER